MSTESRKATGLRVQTAEPVLALQDVKIAYGGIQAVKGISLEVRPGELVSLIGANGAGKTTTLNAIAGVIPLASGQIRYQGEAIERLASHQRLRRGLALVPEGRGIFARLSVAENLRLGAYARKDTEGVAADLERVFALMPRVKERLGQLAGTLSGGEQQMVAIGRAIMSQPRLLLLDEPSMGLAPIIVETIFEAIRSVVAGGTSVLLVEQNAHLALEFSDRAYVMESGRISLQGSGAALLADPQVRAAYLGEDELAA